MNGLLESGTVCTLQNRFVYISLKIINALKQTQKKAEVVNIVVLFVHLWRSFLRKDMAFSFF